MNLKKRTWYLTRIVRTKVKDLVQYVLCNMNVKKSVFETQLEYETLTSQ